MTLDELKSIYKNQNDCMGDLLYNIPADGMSVADAFELAICASRWADGDRFFRLLGTADVENIPEQFEEL